MRLVEDLIQKRVINMSEVLYHGPIVGISFRKDALRRLVKFTQGLIADGEEFEIIATLKHDPKNPHDQNALEVHVGVGDALFFVGFVPKTHNQQILAVGIENVGVIIEKFNKDLEEVIKGINIIVKGTEIDQNHSDPVDCD